MLITNFDKKEEVIYREAVKRYGLNTLYVDSNAYVNGVKDNSISALRCNDFIRDLTEFWEIFDDVKHNLKIVNKYKICDRVLVRINYANDRRKKAKGIIYGIEYNEESYSIRYKIKFEPSNFLRNQGCEGSEGYVNENDIIKLL